MVWPRAPAAGALQGTKKVRQCPEQVLAKRRRRERVCAFEVEPKTKPTKADTRPNDDPEAVKTSGTGYRTVRLTVATADRAPVGGEAVTATRATTGRRANHVDPISHGRR